ncbi:hypothetical protein KAR48_03600 [bacterium]|nr:hypothetical protein [bacterium]
MMRTLRLVLLLCLPALLTSQTLLKRSIEYDIDDWITYPMGRYITSIATSPDLIYFGTTAGVIVWNSNHEQWEKPYTVSSGMIDDYVLSVFFDANTGVLWVVAPGGVSYLEPASQEFYVNDNLSSLGSPVVSVGKGNAYYWVQTENSIFQSDRLDGYFYNMRNKSEFENDRIKWFNGRQLQEPLPELFVDDDFHYFPSPGYLQDYNLRQYNITLSVKNEFQQMWMGIWGLGMGQADLRMERLAFHPYGPWVEAVRGLAWSETGLWVGGNNKGRADGAITHWDWEDETWTAYEASIIMSLYSDRVNAIDGAGRYTWFATDEGLAAFDEYEHTWRSWGIRHNLWTSRINHITLGEAGLWIATDAGLCLQDTVTLGITRIRDPRLIHRRIWRVEADGPNCWAGTDRGLYFYDGRKQNWTQMPRPGNMMVQNVTALSAFDDEIWAGTDDGVMMYAGESDQWKTFPAAHTPTEGRVHTILADSACVWIGTDNGLLCYTRDEERWRRFTVDDGLPDNRIFSILMDGDYLMLGTGRGLTRFFWNSPMRHDL